jgi:hypothetical protein
MKSLREGDLLYAFQRSLGLLNREKIGCDQSRVKKEAERPTDKSILILPENEEQLGPG